MLDPLRKHAFALLPLVLAGCGPEPTGIAVTVDGGVAMADIETIRSGLSRVPGVGAVLPGELKDGKATFSVRYAGKGGSLAAELAREGSPLKGVKGFDDASVQVAWAPRAGPADPGAPAAPAAPPEPAPPAEGTPPAPDPARVEKDPLAYKVHQLAGGTVATFDGWRINPVPMGDAWTGMETHPEGKENDFQLLVTAGIPDARVQANLFEEGAATIRRLFPTLRDAGEARKTEIGGDEARVQDCALEFNGKTLKVQSVMIKKKDVAVGILAFGTDDGWKAYGRSVMITAQSITVKESPPDPALVGTWVLDSYRSSGTGTSNQFSYSSSTSITIFPNGTFTESSFSSANLDNTTGNTSAYLEGGDRGRVTKIGTVLAFRYDNGKVWSPEFKVDGGALVLNGKYWFRQ